MIILIVLSLHIQHCSSLLTIHLQNNVPRLQSASFMNLSKHSMRKSPKDHIIQRHQDHLMRYTLKAVLFRRKCVPHYIQLTMETVLLKSLPPQIYETPMVVDLSNSSV